MPGQATINVIRPREGSGGSGNAAGWKDFKAPELNNDYITQSWQAIEAGIPQGMSGQDLNNMQAQIGAGNDAAASQSLEKIAQNAGGDVSNPLYMMNAARIRAGAAANTGAAVADIKMKDKQKSQDLEMQRRNQMANMAGLNSEFERIRAEMGLRAQELRQSGAVQDANIARLNAETANIGKANDPNSLENRLAILKAMGQFPGLFGLLNGTGGYNLDATPGADLAGEFGLPTGQHSGSGYVGLPNGGFNGIYR